MRLTSICDDGRVRGPCSAGSQPAFLSGRVTTWPHHRMAWKWPEENGLWGAQSSRTSILATGGLIDNSRGRSAGWRAFVVGSPSWCWCCAGRPAFLGRNGAGRISRAAGGNVAIVAGVLLRRCRRNDRQHVGGSHRLAGWLSPREVGHHSSSWSPAEPWPSPVRSRANPPRRPVMTGKGQMAVRRRRVSAPPPGSEFKRSARRSVVTGHAAVPWSVPGDDLRPRDVTPSVLRRSWRAAIPDRRRNVAGEAISPVPPGRLISFLEVLTVQR